MVTHSVFLPGKLHGQRSLEDCHPWGHKESDRTEQLSAHRYTRGVCTQRRDRQSIARVKRVASEESKYYDTLILN